WLVPRSATLRPGHCWCRNVPMRAYTLGLGFVLLTVGTARGQYEPTAFSTSKPYRNYPGCPCPSAYPNYPSDPTAPQKDGKEPAAEPEQNQFAGATEAGTQPGAMFNPNMFGDLIGISGSRIVRLGTGATTVARGLPISGRYNGFKITDNESPRPVDRVF